jgi:hypothetical protein
MLLRALRSIDALPRASSQLALPAAACG